MSAIIYCHISTNTLNTILINTEIKIPALPVLRLGYNSVMRIV